MVAVEETGNESTEDTEEPGLRLRLFISDVSEAAARVRGLLSPPHSKTTLISIGIRNATGMRALLEELHQTTFIDFNHVPVEDISPQSTIEIFGVFVFKQIT